MNGDMADISGMLKAPDDLENMTMKEVKEFITKQQEASDIKRRAMQKLCWDEIGEVCKKYNCKVKPVVQLHEMENGQYTFYADLVVVAMELPDEQPSEESSGETSGETSGEPGDKSNDKESSDSTDDARKEQGHESPGSEDDKA